MTKLPTKEDLKHFLQASVDRFNGSVDCESLLRAPQAALDKPVSRNRVAHEQAISHRLAYYLEDLLRKSGIVTDEGPLVVDCEYNQHLFDRKKLRILLRRAQPFLKARRSVIPIRGSRTIIDFEIRPDVLLHMRGEDGPKNLLVLEVKRWTNPDRKHDELKLELLTKLGVNTFGYVLGAAVYARNDRKPEQRILEVGQQFHSGEPC
jgi:hypothetical protein